MPTITTVLGVPLVDGARVGTVPPILKNVFRKDVSNRVSTPEDIKTEIHNRLWVALAAYAYEIENTSIISDAEFDALAVSIRPEISTGNAELDNFFRTEFDPCTGSWIYCHPGLNRLKEIYKNAFANG